MVYDGKAMPPTDLKGGTTPELVAPSSKLMNQQKGVQVSNLISYPFMHHNFCSASSATQNGFLGGSMFQDLVMRASSGVLQFPELYGSIGNSSCTVGTSSVILGDTHTQPTNMVDQDHPCTLDSSRIANTDWGDSMVAENIKESVAVPSAETDTDMNTEVVPKEGIQDISDLNGEQELKIWPKWKRLPEGAPKICQTRLMSPIERALRNAPSRKTTYIFEPSLSTKFNCLTEAKEFYNIYSWERGFGTKKGDKDGDRMQEFHCQCKGSDNRVQYKTMKKKCPAMVRLRRTEDFGWYICEFRDDHNHPLSESCAEKLCWNSHGDINQCTKDMIRYLRDENVTLTKVNHIMGKMVGPTGEPSWSQNSISNLCKSIAKEQRADDVRKTLEVFKGLKKQDPGFRFCLDYDNKNRIKTLMWCTGKSRSQYACFGDVVTFDTTYCTNIYKMPFGLFVGVNNHFQSTIFAGVLMIDETAESFKWVFEQFVELMGGTKPQTILTDQCQAMAIAIAQCWQGTAHLWCKWHVLRTAQEELGPIFNYGTPFHDEFSKIINEMLTIDEFESAWDQLLEKYSLRDNEFMQRTYKKRERWAKPYNKGVFCAGMTSTQRSESANHMLKQHVPRNSSMNKFVMNYNNLLLTRYKAEAEAEHRTKQVVYVHERAWPIEMHAMQVYTNALYELFRLQVDKSTRYNVIDTNDPSVYMVVHNKAKRRERWARVEFTVQIHDAVDLHDGGSFFECDCGLYSHLGIVCCHTIRVMLHIGISRIPDRHIMNRWTRVARDVLPNEMNFYHSESLPVQTLTYRHRLLDASAERMKMEGDYDAETFEIAMKHMSRGFMEIADYMKIKAMGETDGFDSNDERSSGENGTDTDGEFYGNSYGAAGCSAGLSDSELLRMRPPEAKRVSNRPRVTRFKSRLDIIQKKLKKKRGNMGSKKKKNKCTTCGLEDHKASECHTKTVDMSMPLL